MLGGFEDFVIIDRVVFNLYRYRQISQEYHILNISYTNNGEAINIQGAYLNNKRCF